MAENRSFTTVVREKFMDTIENVISHYVEENFESLELETHRVKKVDEAFLADAQVQLHRVIPYESNDDTLNFDAVIVAQIEIFQKSHSQALEDDVTKWFCVACRVTVNDGFHDLQIDDINEYDSNEKCPNKILTDSLVPYISTKDLEKIAKEILQKIYPEALAEPTKIDVRLFAERLGLQIEERRLSRNGTIFGQMIFHDSTVNYFDLDKGRFDTLNATGGTIFVDPEVYFLRSLGSWNNTVIHECVHWLKHRKCIELERFYNGDISRISCQVSESKVDEKKRSNNQWMEWHANSLAPRILMPIEPFSQKAAELIKWYKEDRQTGKIGDIISSVIYELSNFFEVSMQSAKIRLIDIGYTDAIGASEFVDGGYVQSYSYKEGSINKNQTFSVPMVDGLYQYAINADFRQIIDTGNFIYIDSHYCINNSKYVVQNDYGLLEMTEYALGHMDECCLVFERTFRDNANFGVKHYSECILFQTAISPTITELGYSQGTHNQSVSSFAAEIAEAKEVAKISAELPGTFSKSLDMLMKWRNITNESLAEKSLLNSKSIQRMKNNADMNFKLETVVAVCIGLNLHPSISHVMIEKAGLKIKGIERDVLYSHILSTRYKSTIHECNELLQEANYPVLSGKE